MKGWRIDHLSPGGVERIDKKALDVLKQLDEAGYTVLSCTPLHESTKVYGYTIVSYKET